MSSCEITVQAVKKQTDAGESVVLLMPKAKYCTLDPQICDAHHTEEVEPVS